MPHTLPNIREILKTVLSTIEPTQVQLLVVPGLDWQSEDILQLQQWADEGYELAGHGWCHEVRAIQGWYHWWHSLLISRRAAEHLSQSREALVDLLQRNYQWFAAHGLAAPKLYVPPAWALGHVQLADVRKAGFEYLETTKGIAQLETESWQRLPLAGFEADVRWRQLVLQWWNLGNAKMASAQRPLRLSLHPFDLQYHLSGQLRSWLPRRVKPMHYADLFQR